LIALGLLAAAWFDFNLPAWVGWAVGCWLFLSAAILTAGLKFVDEILGITMDSSVLQHRQTKEIFISYNRETADFARALWERLETLGIPTWFGESQILVAGRKELANENILRMILAHGISRSRNCVFLLSPKALQSEWVMDVETWLFRRKERQNEGKCIYPVAVGTTPTAELPGFLQGREVVRWRDPRRPDDILPALLGMMGLQERYQPPRVPRRPGVVRRQKATITTERRRLTYSVEFGPDWRQLEASAPGLALNVQNERTGVMLNMLVGAMSEGAVDRAIETIPEIVERQNLQFERFAISVGEILASHLLNVEQFAGRGTGQQEEPALSRPHFAVSYRRGSVLFRKYILLVRPWDDNRYFDFVYTAGYKGEYKAFLERIGEVDDLIRSFRLEGHTLVSSTG